jgi:D-alanyl-D-alanine carboxypeptidase (penicillin-binding protein 5/6)
MTPRHHTPHSHIAITILCCVFLGIGATVMAHQEKRSVPSFIESTDLANSHPYVPTYNTDVFKNIELTSKAFLVFDVTHNKEIFSKNAHVQKPIASLTKIVSANVIMENFPKESLFEVTPYSAYIIGNHGFAIGEKYTRDELISFGLNFSSNTAMATITQDSESFIALMNNYARRITSRDTMYFRNSTGLDVTIQESGGVGTAYDVLDVLLDGTKRFPEVFTSSVQKKITIPTKGNTIENTNIILDKIPSIRTSKTGFTNRAGGALAFLFETEPGHVIGVVILDSTFADRFHDAEKIVWATLESLIISDYDSI